MALFNKYWCSGFRTQFPHHPMKFEGTIFLFREEREGDKELDWTTFSKLNDPGDAVGWKYELFRYILKWIDPECILELESKKAINYAFMSETDYMLSLKKKIWLNPSALGPIYYIYIFRYLIFARSWYIDLSLIPSLSLTFSYTHTHTERVFCTHGLWSSGAGKHVSN